MRRANDYFLFVYGTLRRAADNDLSRLLAANSDFVGNAVYQGRLYQIGRYPGAVPSTDSKHKVQGEVYRLRNMDSLLSCLDRYEEIGPRFPQPYEYRRRQQKVRLDNGNIITAWIYLYNRSTAGLEAIESNNDGHDAVLTSL